jgi:hypothetical protein
MLAILPSMDAELILRTKSYGSDDTILEMTIWRTPTPVEPSQHHFKYRLVLIHRGKRVIGFDNERGKGDHWHLGSHQRPYFFRTPETLIEDFIREVERWQRER